MTDHDKVVCLNMQLEMAAACTSFEISHDERLFYSSGPIFRVIAHFNDAKGTEATIRVEGEDLIAVVSEAYTRFDRVVGKLPELDNRKLLEHGNG